MCYLLCTLFALATACRASPVANHRPYPFNHIVAFGDEFSDNGNGSLAHGLDGVNGNYGFGTWTDGPVAVSYLADLLDVSLRDLAWGGSKGGSDFGSTIDNAYSPSDSIWDGKPVPSVHDQIHLNYTRSHPPLLKSTLEFIWVGQNELLKQTDWFWPSDPRNDNFTRHMTEYTVADAEFLVKLGAPYVFVANIYPKHLAPVTRTYLCPDGSCVDNLGAIIKNTNTAIKTALERSKYHKQFIYYDAFGFMVDLMQRKDSYGLTAPLNYLCDGGGNQNWTDCISGSTLWEGAKKYYWMTYTQPTTTVHELIAKDMKATIEKFLA